MIQGRCLVSGGYLQQGYRELVSLAKVGLYGTGHSFFLGTELAAGGLRVRQGNSPPPIVCA
jgi:hypothetical protein